MALEKSFIEIWSDWVLRKFTFLWLPIAAMISIIKRIRKQREEK